MSHFWTWQPWTDHGENLMCCNRNKQTVTESKSLPELTDLIKPQTRSVLTAACSCTSFSQWAFLAYKTNSSDWESSRGKRFQPKSVTYRDWVRLAKRRKTGFALLGYNIRIKPFRGIHEGLRRVCMSWSRNLRTCMINIVYYCMDRSSLQSNMYLIYVSCIQCTVSFQSLNFHKSSQKKINPCFVFCC